MASQPKLPKISKAVNVPMKFNIIATPKPPILSPKNEGLKNEGLKNEVLKNDIPKPILKNEVLKNNVNVLPKIATPAKRKMIEPKIATPARAKSFTIISNDLQKVPTTDIIPPKTPRSMQREKLAMEVDPMMNASFYLNNGNNTNVSTHMKSLSKNIKGLQHQYKNILKPIPSDRSMVKKNRFDELLSIYENNQVYYQEQMDDATLDIEVIKQKLTELEHWFMAVVEPKPTDDVEGWMKRENSKILTGYSPYCDPELHTYIKPAPLDLLSLIKRYHVIGLQ